MHIVGELKEMLHVSDCGDLQDAEETPGYSVKMQRLPIDMPHPWYVKKSFYVTKIKKYGTPSFKKSGSRYSEVRFILKKPRVFPLLC